MPPTWESVMSHRKTDPGEPTASSNVVVLPPPGGGAGNPGGAQGTHGAPAVHGISALSDAMTHDGLDLLRAFLAIEDAAARASLVVLAQKLAARSPKG